MPDDTARVLALKSGSVNVVNAVPYSQLASLSKESGLAVFTKVIGIIEAIYFNEHNKPLDETGVRQALNYATPRDSINEVVFAGIAEPANSMLPKMRWWDSSVKVYPYDLAKAKQLISQSSQPSGFDVTLMLVGSDQGSKQIAQILQQAWKEIGITLTLRQVDTAGFFDNLLKGTYDLGLFPTGTANSDVAEPDELYQIFYVADIFHFGYSNTLVIDKVKQVMTTQDNTERERLMKEIQRLGYEDPYGIPLMFAPVRFGLQSDVKGFNAVTPGWWRLDQVWIGGK